MAKVQRTLRNLLNTTKASCNSMSFFLKLSSRAWKTASFLENYGKRKKNRSTHRSVFHLSLSLTHAHTHIHTHTHTHTQVVRALNIATRARTHTSVFWESKACWTSVISLRFSNNFVAGDTLSRPSVNGASKEELTNTTDVDDQIGKATYACKHLSATKFDCCCCCCVLLTTVAPWFAPSLFTELYVCIRSDRWGKGTMLAPCAFGSVFLLQEKLKAPTTLLNVRVVRHFCAKMNTTNSSNRIWKFWLARKCWLANRFLSEKTSS